MRWEVLSSKDIDTPMIYSVSCHNCKRTEYSSPYEHPNRKEFLKHLTEIYWYNLLVHVGLRPHCPECRIFLTQEKEEA